MSTELTTLLPSRTSALFVQDYLLRLATVGVLLLAGVVCVGGLLLMPSYVYERQAADREAATLAHLSTNLASSAEQQVQAESESIRAKTAALQTLSTAATAGGALQAILAVSRPGVVLTGITFAPPTDATSGNMQLTGIASTRESLRNYVSSLSALSYVSNADLPISAYAQESNIPFTITLTGMLKP